MRESARHPRGMPPGGGPAGSWRPRRWQCCRPPDLRCPRGVRGRLDGDLAYTTVVTLLSRLHTKGVLGRKAGRGASCISGSPTSQGWPPAAWPSTGCLRR